MKSQCNWQSLFLVGAFWLCGCGQLSPPVNTPSERDEQRGGHTLDRHVGRTDAELQERLERERNISAASTWIDRGTAEEVVAEALRAEHRRIESWMRRGERRPNLALHYDAGRVTGRSLRRGESQAVPCTSAVIVLRASGPESFYVLTTYPEARE